MGSIQLKKDLIEQLIEISKEAGEAVLEIYKTDFDFQMKEDLSPLTKADTISNQIICSRLKALTPDIPILSEENSDIPFNIRSLWKQYWLVDPLDGTKEFIKRNGEFTVNIALIENNRPVFGLIYVPFSNQIYWGLENKGSYLRDQNSNEVKINVSNNTNHTLRIAISRSHPSLELISCLEKIEDFELIKAGSSLKFCLIAKGEADCYPRIGPTCEWDTAAGEAIARFAGGHVITTDLGPIKYNASDSYINPNFIVSTNKTMAKYFFSLL